MSSSKGVDLREVRLLRGTLKFLKMKVSTTPYGRPIFTPPETGHYIKKEGLN